MRSSTFVDVVSLFIPVSVQLPGHKVPCDEALRISHLAFRVAVFLYSSQSVSSLARGEIRVDRFDDRFGHLVGLR